MRMVRAALGVGLALVVVMAPAAFWLRGEVGLWTAMGALGVVVGGFAISGLAIRFAARHSPGMVTAAIMISFLLRMLAYVALVVVFAPRDIVDAATLAVVVPVTLIAMLAVEARLIIAHPEFRMIDPAPLVPTGKDPQ